MSFPIEAIRKKFPSLSVKDDGKGRVYLDNPAGSQVPKSVADAIYQYLMNDSANLHGAFITSEKTEKLLADTHLAMADFMGTDDPDEIIIGASTTGLAFHLSRSIFRDFKAGDEIIVTRMDHEGNISPWLEAAADKGLKVNWLDFDEDSWQLEVEDLKKLLNERTRFVSLNYASNLTGMINDIKGLTAAAKEVGATVYVDAVQLAPHGLLSVNDLGCDFLTCSSYKFFGPHLGIVWGKKQRLEEMHAYKCRTVGDMDFPTKFTTGTPPFEALAGLLATINYYSWLGEQVGEAGSRREKIATAFAASGAYEEGLTKRLLSGLKAIDGVEIIGSSTENQISRHVPTVSFRHDSKTPRQIATSLAMKNIFVWDGHNYALAMVEQLGIPVDEGVVRIGAAHYNTLEEIDQTVAAVKAAVG